VQRDVLKILLVDDEQDVRTTLAGFLNKLGHAVVDAKDGTQGLRRLNSHDFDLVLTDIRMPKMDGLELLRQIKKIRQSSLDVIVITGHGDMDNAIKALRYGAYDYLQKPIDVRELALVIERCQKYVRLRKNYTRLKTEFDQQVLRQTQACRGETERLREAYFNEVGLDDLRIFSEPMRKVLNLAEKYSPDRSVPVLIQGESGTGKELIARYIHYYSTAGKSAPFVAINCGAITPSLMEGEFFGHVAGAFTGATTSGRSGKLEAAHGGTIFLDEIGEMPQEIQVKLLRVLEEKKLYRVGSVQEIPIDIRVISATNKDLQKEVAARRFRLDLLYRINLAPLQIPPLRKRQADILPLALNFLSQAAARAGKKFGGFSSSAEKRLLSYPWPGNIRELKNAMERLALTAVPDRVEEEDLTFITQATSAPAFIPWTQETHAPALVDLPDDKLDLEALNRQIIIRALEKNHGNQTRTAQYLGLTRRMLQGRLKKMGIERG